MQLKEELAAKDQLHSERSHQYDEVRALKMIIDSPTGTMVLLPK